MPKQNITPPSYSVTNVQSLPDLIEGDAPNVKATFDRASLDGKTYIADTLITELNGNAGANKIGFSNINIAANNVGDAVEEVRLIAVQAQAGEIGQNSLGNDKLQLDIQIGSLSSLNTLNKSNVTSAINEVQSELDAMSNSLNNATSLVNVTSKAVTSTGSSVAYALNLGQSFSLSQIGAKITMLPNVSNIGSATLNVSGTGALPIYKNSKIDGSTESLSAKDIMTGNPTSFIVMGSYYLLDMGLDTRIEYDNGFRNGLEIDATTGKLALAKNPQRISNEVTVNESKTTVFNSVYDINLAGQYQRRYSRGAVVMIKSTTSEHSCFVVLDLGKMISYYYGSDGSFLYKSAIKENNDSNIVTAASNLGAGLLTGGTTHQYAFKVYFDDSTEFQNKIRINVASIGGANYTLAFKARALFV